MLKKKKKLYYYYKRGITQQSKTSGSNVYIQDLISGHLEFMQITSVSKLPLEQSS